MADIRISRQTVISFPEENIPSITEGIMDGSLLVSEILLSNSIAFGEINCNKFEVDLQYASDLTGKKIYVYQIIDDVQTPIFTGYVQSSKLDDFGAYRKVVAYDLFYTQGSQDAAAWWNIFWQNHESSTLGEVLRNFLTYFNIPYVDKTLLNDSMSVSKTQEFSSIRVIDMMKLLCEANICNPNVNRTGQVEFITVYNTTAVSVTDNYEWDASTFEDYSINPIGLVQIYNKDGHIAVSVGSGTNCLRIKDNLFFYDKSNTDLNTIATRIYNAVSSLTYMPASIKLILSDPRIKVGTVVTSSKGNSLVCEIEMSGPMLIEETIRSVGEEILAEADSFDPVESRASETATRTTNLEGTTAVIQANVRELYGMISGAYILPFGIVLDEVTDIDQGGTPNNVLMFRYTMSENNSIALYARLSYNVHTFVDESGNEDVYQDAQVTTKYLLDGAVITQDVKCLTDGWHTETYVFLISDAPSGTHDIYLSLQSKGASLFSMNAVTGYLVILGAGLSPSPVPGIDVKDLSEWEKTTSVFTIASALGANSVSFTTSINTSIYDAMYKHVTMVLQNTYDITFDVYSPTGFSANTSSWGNVCMMLLRSGFTETNIPWANRAWESDAFDSQPATDYTHHSYTLQFATKDDVSLVLRFWPIVRNTYAEIKIKDISVTRRDIDMQYHELQVGEWISLAGRKAQLIRAVDNIALRIYVDNGWAIWAVFSNVELQGKFDTPGNWGCFGSFTISDGTQIYISFCWGALMNTDVQILDSSDQVIKVLRGSNEMLLNFVQDQYNPTPRPEITIARITPEFDAFLVNRWGGNNS